MDKRFEEPIYILLWCAVIVGVAAATLYPYSTGFYGAPIITSGVNLYSCDFQQPAPMGITDYGVGAYGQTYNYSTSSFLGKINIMSLHANSSGDYNMTIQLNANIAFTHGNNTFVYWGQNVAYIDTHTNSIAFIDNVWNSSGNRSDVNASAITGRGNVGNGTRNSTYYFYEYNLSKNYGRLHYPDTIYMRVNASTSGSGLPEIRFSFDAGHGWITYDNVTFTGAAGSDLLGLEVSGQNYTPGSTFYDAEFVLGGNGGGSNTTLINSSMNMALDYWNGHNYQSVYNAYNYGCDTEEGISNTSENLAFNTFGAPVANISSGSGGLGSIWFYNRSNVGLAEIYTGSPNGYIVLNETNTNKSRIYYTGGKATLTLQPSEYNISVYYSNGTLYRNGFIKVIGNKISTLNMSAVFMG